MMPDEYEEWFVEQKMAKGLCSMRGCTYPLLEGARYCSLHDELMTRPLDPPCDVEPERFHGGGCESEHRQSDEEINERAKRILTIDDRGHITGFSEAQGTSAGKLLHHVAGLVDGPRNVLHGDKVASFRAIAKAWARIFGWPVSGSQVAQAMVALKEQRLRHGSQDPKDQRQHVEDILGYWAIYMELREAGE